MNKYFVQVCGNPVSRPCHYTLASWCLTSSEIELGTFGLTDQCSSTELVFQKYTLIKDLVMEERLDT